MELSARDLAILNHMLGIGDIPKCHWGYRNRYVAGIGGLAEQRLRNLEKAGLVKQGQYSETMIWFHCTPAGCLAAGLNAEETKRALEH